jgi:class 3 adenylate cyclase/predicted ATPase
MKGRPMTFDAILDQAIEMLRRHGRVTYRALKRQFSLDDEYLEDLKDAILFVYPVVDADGRGLVWTGDPVPPEPDVQPRADADARFYALLRVVTGLLQRDRRVTYRELKHVLGLDEALLGEIRQELTFKRLAIDEEGKGLVWTGDAQPVTHAAMPVPRPPATAETTLVSSAAAPTLPAPVTEADTRTNAPTAPPEAISTDVPQDEPIAPPESSRSAPDAERRQLTVMFCDLADSTKLSQQLDPEDLREVIRAYQATAAAVIQQYDGHIAQYLGDGVLVYFGWPRAHEDDAQRALHTGLGLVEALTTTLNPRLVQDKGVQLAVRIGIHTGPVVVGAMGGGTHVEHLATGDTVNIAARLEALAASNTVVLSPVTAHLVEGVFVLEDLGLHSLKGVAEPMQVFRVLDPIAVHEDDAIAIGMPFLVGRDEEMGLLLRRWQQSKAGLGQVVLISGEAGIGKSSLVETLRAQVHEEGLPRIAYRCSPYHTNSVLYPVIDHVQRVLHWQRDDPPEVKLDKLERGLAGYRLVLEEVVPLFAALLSVPVPEGRYAALQLTPQQQKQRTLDALVAWLLAEAERQPIAVVWEDLHWADPSTLELLGLVLEQTPTVPMLSVLTFRPAFPAPWPTHSHMTPLTLNRLERPQVKALIAHLTDGKTLPAEVVEHLIAKTDGVPLYVEELTKMLLASDLLRQEADVYVLTGPLAHVAIPATLQDSLMARLDQMNMAKEVAQVGAVLGREFSYEMLQVIASQDDETLQTGLAQLVEAELLYQRGRPPRAKYIFKHALIQDAAYASLLRSQRQPLHARIAGVLEQRFPEVVEAEPELLAHHLTEAGMTDPAIDYWLKAGERAIRGSANLEAVSHLRRGLELVETLPDTLARAQKELLLQAPLGATLTATKGYTAVETKAAYTRAYELCRHGGQTEQVFQVLYGVWNFLYVGIELHQALELAEEGLAMAARQSDAMPYLVSHDWMGMTLMSLGDLPSAKYHSEQALTFHDPDQHRHLVYQCGEDPRYESLYCLALVNWMLGYPEQSKQHSRDSIAWARELAYDPSIATTLMFASIADELRGDFDALQVRAEELVTLSTQQSIAIYVGFGMVFLGVIMIEQGDVDLGIEQIVEGSRLWGPNIFEPYRLSLRARGHQRAGRHNQAMHLLEEALDGMHKTGEHMWEAELYRLRGECLLMQESPSQQMHENHHLEAEACFQQALDIARNQQAKSWELRAATSLARLWQSQDKRQEAYDLLAPVYNWFTEGFDTADLQKAQALLNEFQGGGG